MRIDLPDDEDGVRRRHWGLPTDRADLLRIWGADSGDVAPVLEFLRSPAAEPMPPEVLIDLAEWLDDHDALDRLPAQAKRRLRELRVGRD